MPWGNKPGPCPCNKCAEIWPATNVISSRGRTRHKQAYGVPGELEVKDEPDDIPPPVVAPVVAPHVPHVPDVDMEGFAKDLVLIVINHNIPWKGAELMVKLFNARVFGREWTQKLPATMYQLKKITQCQPGHSRLFHVCPICDFVFNDGQTVCTCGLPPRWQKVPRQLIVYDVSVRIKQMFANPMLAKVNSHYCRRVFHSLNIS